jgi:hypothetical protein
MLVNVLPLPNKPQPPLTTLTTDNRQHLKTKREAIVVVEKELKSLLETMKNETSVRLNRAKRALALSRELLALLTD